MPVTYQIREEEPLGCDLPYVEDFPKNKKLPNYVYKSLLAFGNTVISNKLLKVYGWNGVQWHCAKKGFKVTVRMSCYDNCIVEVFGNRGFY